MALKRRIKIAVTDDQRLFREGIISLIEENKDMKVMIDAVNGKDLIAKLAKEEVDVVLLDLEMPVMDGIKTTEYLRRCHPRIKILILTMHDDDAFILHLIEKGAAGYLLKDSNIETVTEAIYSVMESEYYFSDRVSQVMLKGLVEKKKIKPSFNNAELTDREIEVIKFICEELTAREIGDKLGISTRTVESHREVILQKTGARNTAGIVMYAVKNNLHK